MTPVDRTPLRRMAAPLAALALLIGALTITPITNNDLFLHLRTGERVLSTGQVPRVDDYSALARGRPFTAHEWLSGVIFELVRRAGGPAGFDALLLFKSLAALLLAATLFAAARSMGAPPGLIMPPLALVMILAAARFLERPHIFTYLLTALYLLVLARRRGGSRGPLPVLIPLQVLWANLHGGFLLGPAVVGLAGGALLIEGLSGPVLRLPAGEPHTHAAARLREGGRLIGLAVLLAACCLVNPYGWRLLAFPFHLTGSGFMQEIYEWQPPFSSAFAATYMMRYYIIWALLGAGTYIAAGWVAVRRRAAPPGGLFPALLFLFFVALSLRMNRNVTDFALATLPGVAATGAWLAAPVAGRRRWRLAPTLGTAVLLGLAAWFATQGYPYGPSSRRPFGLGLAGSIPVAGADYLESRGIDGNVFNSYSAGAYLIWRFYPSMRVSMDSRNDVYGEELYARHARAQKDPQALSGLLHQIDATCIVLQWTEQGAVETATTVRAMGGWSLVFFDDWTMVYLRDDGPHAAAATRDRYGVLDPALFRPAQATGGQAGLALEESARAGLAAGPGRDAMARVMQVDALMSLGRGGEARLTEEVILREDPPLHHIYYYLGRINLAHGEDRRAAEMLRRSLRLNPGSVAAREALDDTLGKTGAGRGRLP